MILISSIYECNLQDSVQFMLREFSLEPSVVEKDYAEFTDDSENLIACFCDGKLEVFPNQVKTITGMYKGTKPFDREQLVFVVQVAMAASWDRVFACLPTNVDDLPYWEKDKKSRKEMIHGYINHFAAFVPILWAQTEGKRIDDGMAIGEFVEFQNLVNRKITSFVLTASGCVEEVAQPDFVDMLLNFPEEIIDQWMDVFGKRTDLPDHPSGGTNVTVRIRGRQDFDIHVPVEQSVGWPTKYMPNGMVSQVKNFSIQLMNGSTNGSN